MKKSHKFDKLSNVRCEIQGCIKRIKQRLAKKNKVCFRCHQEIEAARGHRIKFIPFAAFRKNNK